MRFLSIVLSDLVNFRLSHGEQNITIWTRERRFNLG